MCQQGFLFKLTDIKLNVSQAHISFLPTLLPRHTCSHSMTEMLIDDRRCPLRATGLGHLTCIPSEMLSLPYTMTSPFLSLSHTDIIHKNIHKHTAGNWIQENNTGSNLRSRIHNQQAQDFSSHTYLYTHTHEHTYMRLKGCSPSRMYVKIHHCIRGTLWPLKCTELKDIRKDLVWEIVDVFSFVSLLFSCPKMVCSCEIEPRYLFFVHMKNYEVYHFKIQSIIV